MDKKTLLQCIRALPAYPQYGSWLYRSEGKEVWIRWLEDYGGPGYYKRADWNKDAKFVYNHINSPAMLQWLICAAGAPVVVIEKVRRIDRSHDRGVVPFATACGMIRKIMTWENIEPLLVWALRSSRKKTKK